MCLFLNNKSSPACAIKMFEAYQSKKGFTSPDIEQVLFLILSPELKFKHLTSTLDRTSVIHLYCRHSQHSHGKTRSHLLCLLHTKCQKHQMKLLSEQMIHKKSKNDHFTGV